MGKLCIYIFALSLVGIVAACTPPQTSFMVVIKNISDQSSTPTSLSPGIFVLHDQSFALFMENEPDNGLGLEALAEDGNPALLATNIAFAPGVAQSGLFSAPEGQGVAAPLLPGERSYQFQITANENAQYLSFATMFLESNDLFFAPRDSGIRLFRFGRPISGNITRHVRLWDASTEVNEQPREGINQAPRQLGPDIGLSETGPIHTVNDEFNYPSVSQLIEVTISVVHGSP